ncbi:cytochrome c-type biogenesis protein [Echinimonas agarilytica]|uniref:Cytochrome c-type biogenesis protein n=1 Tax=Echinimonas agarilytica TaxID=1215918 RepID=A0AA41W4Z7_9GAMM|nr:cytochrome c-type biogenesis protein [Echinimonas agarilytica]MCM2679005.1 cytochrome c-type biogenesis protein CcmH [Echinimonas agarilytica]
MSFNRLISIGFAATLGLISLSANATIDAYPFQDESKEAEFKELINELRCPKCQNQTISDSDAGLAKDLKDKTYEMVQEGATKREVIGYMVDRYGNFVHYQPPVQSSTWVLWYGPFAFMLVAFIAIVVVIRQRGKTTTSTVELSAQEKARLDELMKKDDSKS